MSFVTRDVAFEAVRVVGPTLKQLIRRNRDLGKQAERAAASIVLNIEEGNRRIGADRTYHFSVAAGSAAELRGALLVGMAWDLIAEPTEALALLDRLGGLLYGLVKPQRSASWRSKTSSTGSTTGSST